jgi:hypothetical protein
LFHKHKKILYTPLSSRQPGRPSTAVLLLRLENTESVTVFLFCGSSLPVLSSILLAAEQVAVANDMSCSTHDDEERHQARRIHHGSVCEVTLIHLEQSNMADSAQLKRLAFVQGYASQGYSTAESVYKTARGFVPSFVEPYAKQAEETAVSIAAPYLTKAQDAADKLLAGVDSQVRDQGRCIQLKALSALVSVAAVA